MSVLLCIETASTNCSVALGINGKILALKEDYSSNFSHAERLHVFIQEILAENELALKDLNAVAVSKGPGSYTGLRIGVSAAKGLCFALDIPLISVPTLMALAYQVEEGGITVSMLDARRMEVYAAAFDKDKQQIMDTAAVILNNDSFADLLDREKVTFIGTGVAKFREICSHKNAAFVEGKLPSAGEMVELATSKYQISDFENVAYFEPYYLKDFIAG